MKNSTALVTCVVRNAHVEQHSNHQRVVSHYLACITKPNFLRRMSEFVGQSAMFILPVLLISLVISTDTRAQDSTAEKKMHFLIEPYFLTPTMKGEIAVRQLPAAEVDADPNDIFGQVKFAAMAYMEMNYDNKWAAGLDFLYMHLQSDLEPGTVVTSGKSDARQMTFEFSGLYRLAPWFEVGAGGRVMDIRVDLDLNTANNQLSGSSRKAWVDPIIIVRSQGTVFEKLLLQFRGDFGGFGINEDYTWQVQANIGYKFSDLVSGSFGYRMLDVKNDKGEGNDYFSYDVLTSGPVLRLGFTFQ